jgi:prepilin-type N-terminal cleavage/methylation domain-containing protein
MPKQGFTLIEILIAVALMTIMAMVVVPNLSKKSAGQERIAFIARLNSLTRLAWQNALVQNKLHRVVFDFKKKTAVLEQETNQKDSKGQPKFEPVKVTYVDTVLSWPEFLQIKNFYIEGFDELSRFAGRDTGQTWFFVVPDGLTQKVTINVADSKDRDAGGRPKKIGLVLNPFNAQFTAYDTFKK